MRVTRSFSALCAFSDACDGGDRGGRYGQPEADGRTATCPHSPPYRRSSSMSEQRSQRTNSSVRSRRSRPTRPTTSPSVTFGSAATGRGHRPPLPRRSSDIEAERSLSDGHVDAPQATKSWIRTLTRRRGTRLPVALPARCAPPFRLSLPSDHGIASTRRKTPRKAVTGQGHDDVCLYWRRLCIGMLGARCGEFPNGPRHQAFPHTRKG